MSGPEISVVIEDGTFRRDGQLQRGFCAAMFQVRRNPSGSRAFHFITGFVDPIHRASGIETAHRRERT
jgi:hypothetical protein